MAGISSDIIRGYNDTIILYLLLDKPSYGYEISKQMLKKLLFTLHLHEWKRMDILLLSLE